MIHRLIATLGFLIVFSSTSYALPTIKAIPNKDNNNVNIVINFDKPVKVIETVSENEVILQFNQTINTINTSEVYSSLPEWVAEFSNSYDSMVFMTSIPSTFAINTVGKTVSLLISPVIVQTEDTTLTKATLLMNEGKYLEARQLMRNYIEINKHDVYGMSLYAQTQEWLLNSASALGAYFNILEKQPNDVGTNYAKQFAFSQIASNAGVGYQYTDFDDDDHQNVFNYNLNTRISRNTSLLVTGALVDLDADEVQELDGTSNNYSNKFYNNVRLSLLYGYDYELDIMPSFYYSNNLVGAGLAFIYKIMQNDIFTVSFDYNRPDFDSSRQIVLDASTDNITFSYQSDFLRGWAFGANVGFVNYNYKNKSNVANSIDTLATISYTIMPVHQDTLILSYSMSGRYFTKNDGSIDAFGTPYNYTNANTYEIHTVNLTWNAVMPGEVTFSPFIGYSYDRYQKGGVVYGLRLFKEEFNRYNFEIYANRGISTYDGTNRDVYSFGTNFNLMF